MDFKALNQTLASLNINPDEIEDERYANAFRILFAIVEMLNEENVSLKAEIQMLDTGSIYSKVNKPNLIFVVLKRTMIYLLKMRGNK